MTDIVKKYSKCLRQCVFSLGAAFLLTSGFVPGAHAADYQNLPIVKPVMSCDQLAQADLSKISDAKIIIKTATQMAVRQGYRNLTRAAIAEKLSIFPSSVSFHCGAMSQLRDDVVAYAIENEYTAVVGQALADRHPLALKAPAALRARAAKLLAA